MAILTVTNLAKHFGERILFSDISFSIASGERIGLIGVNGSGKTTLLRILQGRETADAGTVRLAAGLTAGFVEQNNVFAPG
ncbi:MAG: ATP-binding cassette domain-containing protein, partial [Clostridiales bacterium]|nr:ATP-binding cassette domain-containing protein [Clostridiales bacterium]